MMRYGYGFGNQMMGGGLFGWALMLLFGAIVIAVVVVLIVWAVRSSSGHTHGGPMAPGGTPPAGGAGHDEAVAIAKRRLASGEIDKDQYDAIMRSLNS